jgi:hypothetical protein
MLLTAGMASIASDTLSGAVAVSNGVLVGTKQNTR